MGESHNSIFCGLWSIQEDPIETQAKVIFSKVAEQGAERTSILKWNHTDIIFYFCYIRYGRVPEYLEISV